MNAYLISRNDLIVSCVTVPDYGSVWASIFAAPVASGYSAGSGYGSDSGSDNGEDCDGIDPVSMWRYEGAPKAMRELVKRSDETVDKMREDGIFMWVASVEDAACVKESQASGTVEGGCEESGPGEEEGEYKK